MRVTLTDIVFALSRGLDYVEQDLLGVTTNHGKRVALISMLLGKSLGLSDEKIFDLASCAVLHDNALTMYMLEAGQAGFSRLENLEQHCPLGEHNAAPFPFLGDVRGFILHHHENWDGSGYHKLAGPDIPLGAAIIRVADNMDLALGMGGPGENVTDKIHNHLRRYRQRLYSPEVVDAMLDIATDMLIESINDENIDLVLAGAIPAVGRDLSTTELLDTCRVFAAIIDAKSHYTQNHSAGVAGMARHMGEALGMDQERQDKLEVAALLHDVGKLASPLRILEKPGYLDPDEYAIMKEHARISWEILGAISGLEDVARWACAHHEKLNGTGYPLGLKAEEICFEGRLMAVCDIYHALTESRPHRPGMEHDVASRILRDMVGKGELDADIVERMIEEMAQWSLLHAEDRKKLGLGG